MSTTTDDARARTRDTAAPSMVGPAGYAILVRDDVVIDDGPPIVARTDAGTSPTAAPTPDRPAASPGPVRPATTRPPRWTFEDTFWAGAGS